MPDRRPLLVAVTDLSLISGDFATWADALYQGGVDLIQLRAPDRTRADITRFTESLLSVAPSPDRVQINGQVDVALELGCGIHLPERIAAARPPLAPASRSVHSVGSARSSGDFDFVIAGHIYATSSKSGLPPRGLQWLAEIVNASQVPVVAIGGITAVNAPEVIASGAAGIAVIGALTSADNPGRAAEHLRNRIDTAWSTRNMHNQSTTIDITLNGKIAPVPAGSSILDLLQARELTERLVVVEVNGEIIPRSLFGERAFNAGDQVEIVHFVGGGQIDG